MATRRHNSSITLGEIKAYLEATTPMHFETIYHLVNYFDSMSYNEQDYLISRTGTWVFHEDKKREANESASKP
jgi:hypothetical protein